MIVVVLGHKLESVSIHPRLRNRVDTGLEVLDDEPGAHLLCSGGHTNPSVPVTECAVMREYALEQGIDSERVLLENRARDTIGNGYFSRRVVDQLAGPIETIHVVSSAAHLERATYVFEQCFETDVAIEATGCAESANPDRRRREAWRLSRTRTFFEGVSAGDLPTIRRRLATDHDYYDRESLGPPLPIASR